MNSRDFAAILPFSNCVRAAGTSEFGFGLLKAIKDIVEVDHCVLVNVWPRHAELSAFANRRNGAGEHLTEAYIGGRYREDPLVQEFVTCRVAELDKPVLRSLMPECRFNEAYYERFFVEPGLVDKFSLIVPDSNSTVFLSFYRSTEMGRFSDSDKVHLFELADLLAALVSTHTRLLTTPRVSREVSFKWHTMLSERERSVARLLGRGETAKTAGAMLALSPTSVVTYKQRAFAKLGIATQRELVALTALMN
jgi:DNA-binding CsgD family transcriptional regulator